MTVTETINRMIRTIIESSTWTSAGGNNPVENFIKEYRGVENPDLDSEIRAIMSGSTGEGSEATLEISGGSPGKQKILSSMSKEDVEGMFGKVGLKPQNIAGMLSMTGGQGVSGLLVRGAGLLGPIAGPLAIAMLIEPVTKEIIKELQRPGGFLDKRVKIDSRKEAFAELDRQTRQNTRIGDRQVIIQQFEGFRNFEGFASTNTQELVRESGTRTTNIGLFDRAGGVE